MKLKFISKEVIERPIDSVWRAIADTPAIENWARSKGLVLKSVDDATAKRVGTSWTAPVSVSVLRGTLKAKVAKIEAPERLVVEGNVAGVDAAFRINLKELGPNATQLRVGTVLKASSVLGPITMGGLRMRRDYVEEAHQSLILSFARFLSDTC
jgi:uncharacterized protein YndB with AHSA1/START domain